MPAALVLLCAVLACGCSALFIRSSSLDPVQLAAVRLLCTAGMLLPAYFCALRRSGGFRRRGLLLSVLAGVPFALHLILWNIGVRLTQPANATLLVTLAPLFTPLLFAWIAHEKVVRLEWIATALALAGAGLLALDSVRVSREFLAGDLICLASMLAFCLYLAVGRRASFLPSIWLYVVPVYGVAGCVAWLAAAFRGHGDLTRIPAMEWGWILGLVVLCTLIGHTLINFALSRLRGQVVSVSLQGQVVVAAVLGWWVEGIHPRALFYPAALLVLGGIALILLADRKRSLSGAPAR